MINSLSESSFHLECFQCSCFTFSDAISTATSWKVRAHLLNKVEVDLKKKYKFKYQLTSSRVGCARYCKALGRLSTFLSSTRRRRPIMQMSRANGNVALGFVWNWRLSAPVRRVQRCRSWVFFCVLFFFTRFKFADAWRRWREEKRRRRHDRWLDQVA